MVNKGKFRCEGRITKLFWKTCLKNSEFEKNQIRVFVIRICIDYERPIFIFFKFRVRFEFDPRPIRLSFPLTGRRDGVVESLPMC